MSLITNSLIRSVSVALVTFTAAQAEALTVKSAAVVDGLVAVSGGQAGKYASIQWEGEGVATAGKGGGFSFVSARVPADCVGTLSDGVSTLEVALSGCTKVVGILPSTGQTISYAPGDDGDVRAGLPVNYTNNGDGTVTDHGTGLMWEMKTTANVNLVYTWLDAMAYCAELNAMNGGVGYAGHNDWRMPNMRELLSVVDYTRTNPPIHPAFGPTRGTTNFATYWSSTSWAPAPQTGAWGYEFADSDGTLAFGKGSFLRVRAVRNAK